MKSRNEIIHIDTKLPNNVNDAIQLTNPDSSKVVGYLFGKIHINQKILLDGLNEFKKGLQKYPNRLDMHFGFAYVTREATMYLDMSNSLIDILNISQKIDNK